MFPKILRYGVGRLLGPGYTDTFYLKTQRYRCGFTFCLHGNDENDHENGNI